MTYSGFATGTNYQDFNSHAHVERDGKKHNPLNGNFKFQLTRSRGAWQIQTGIYWTPEKFQLTRSRGAWRSMKIAIFTWRNISTHTLTWSVTGERSVGYILNKFQLTRSRGAWPNLYAKNVMIISFQLTRSRGAWPASTWRFCLRLAKFQLTRSRGAWPIKNISTGGTYQISTHTLTWSVTQFCYNAFFPFAISTHTLTWSVTIVRLHPLMWFYISTHTLTWSVTSVESGA